jgi:CBS domain-containing protein
MTIGSICCREVDTAAPHESVRTAAQRMSTRGVGTLVVTDAQDRAVGILTDRDVTVRVVAARRDPESTRVSEVMTDLVHR